jgi:MATE family multidrug resistance protein
VSIEDRNGEETSPSRRHLLRIAWPIVLANSTVPLLGLADTAVIGNTGTTAELGAIALGALIFNFVYWSFGFLRMGTTGFTAQAAGAGDEAEVRAALTRALLLGGSIGTVLLAMQRPIAWAALGLLGGSSDVESITAGYFFARIWGAPASLATFAVMGSFVGLGLSGQLLRLQLFLNGLNIALDVLFAGVLGWGPRGIALGTAVAEWTTLAVSLALVRRTLASRRSDDEPLVPWARLRDAGKLVHTLGANLDIMIRTLMLLFGFAWFTHQGAELGDRVLAANHLLLQLVTASAYLLDGYAFATETLVGRAIGARRRSAFDLAVRRSTELAAASALVLSAGVLLLGELAVAALTDLGPVRQTASRYLPLAALYVLPSFAAFQLDGIFIGATRTRDMRNMAMLSLLVYLGAWWLLVPPLGNTGLWLAFVVWVIARAATLMLCFPALRRSIGAPPSR